MVFVWVSGNADAGVGHHYLYSANYSKILKELFEHVEEIWRKGGMLSLESKKSVGIARGLSCQFSNRVTRCFLPEFSPVSVEMGSLRPAIQVSARLP
jgi:hypothetical protein